MSELHPIGEWVKAARAGEQTAWNFLYRHHYPGLYAVALRICHNAAYAEDLVQDSFITAYLKLHQLKDPDAFGAWIKRVLIHACYRARKQQQPVARVEDFSAEDHRLCSDAINRELDEAGTRASLYAGISMLPEVLRSTVLLRYFSGFRSYEEIAGLLYIPVGTVRSRLNQAKVKLEEQWRQYEGHGHKFFRESEQWNNYYHEVFSGMHQHDQDKSRFIGHLQPDVQIISPGGKRNHGSGLFDKMIVDDRKFGSWLSPFNVVSSGNMTIIEARHYNSSEHPLHCPMRSVLVLCRNKTRVTKMSLHPFLK